MKNESIKECFVIMPISNNSNYPDGHFDRVYNYLIAPACELAGFKPIRADEINNTNYIALDIIKRIINSDMAICDLSSQNPNVLYELGIRQAFNKPITLIKDKLTKRIFDIQGFRDFEYDTNLRVDNIEKEVECIAELIKNTYESQGKEINSLTTLLSLSPAKLQENKEISVDTELILNSISLLGKRISSIEKISDSNIIGNRNIIIEKNDNPIRVGGIIETKEIDDLKQGNRVYHDRFGIGKIEEIRKGINPERCIVRVYFENEHGHKSLILKYAQLRRVLE